MTSADSQVPLPSYRPVSKSPTEGDSTFATTLAVALTAAGVQVDDRAREAIRAAVTSWRVDELTRMGAAYLATSLFASNLVSRIRTMKGASQPHPHGSEPRVLVFAKEFNDVVETAPDGSTVVAVEEAMRISREVHTMMLARQEADSAKAALTRICSDLEHALGAPDLTRAMEVASAAERSVDLAKTELRAKADMVSNYPTEAELAACYYPVQILSAQQVRDGDVLFEPTERQILYQHGGPRETVQRAEGAAAVVEQLRKGGVVVLRPFGVQAVIALRLRSAQAWIKKLIASEKPLVGKPRHAGRHEGLTMANEFITLEPWFLPPVITDAPVAKGDDTTPTG